jgi:hypothetical protein
MKPFSGQRKHGLAAARPGAVALLALLAPGFASAAVVQLSPRNAERAVRSQTLFIVLHTTEAPERSAFSKLRQRGECHFFVARSGRVYQFIQTGRVAYHAGLSMWQGRGNIDTCSIGIEVSGCHNRPLAAAQIASLAGLVGDLQRRYGIPDEKVLPHCSVAYGRANRWHKRDHRGRKRCGMLFGQTALRSRIGLTARPASDPDVRAGRLAVGDAELHAALYGRSAAPLVSVAASQAPAPPHPPPAPGRSVTLRRGQSAWEAAGTAYRSASTLYVFPDGRRLRGNQVRNWRAVPPGTRIVLNAP